MKAMIYHGERNILYESVPDPQLADDFGAVVKVDQCAICGSDLHLYHGVQAYDKPGFCIVHEFAGEIVEVGRAVNRFEVGDKVLASGLTGCSQCRQCLAGHIHLCENNKTACFGVVSSLPGGQAEGVAVPAADTTLLKIPDGITLTQAVLLTDILPTAYFGVKNADIKPGDTVAVVGLGPVGQLAIDCALIAGASQVYAIDQIPERLKAAELVGAEPIDARGDAVTSILDKTNGQGVDAAIEAVGLRATINTAMLCVRNGGVLSVVGTNLEADFPFRMDYAMSHNLTFRIGKCPVPEMWADLVPLVQAGKLSPERVVTHKLGLSEGEYAYEIFDARTDGVLKIMMDPGR
jgi:threonine dehydrogenase-like Zn-dependent dehydrogenase